MSPRSIETDARIAAIASRLTPRERDMVSGIAAGKTHKQIAADLSIARGTVVVTCTRLNAKLGSVGAAAPAHIRPSAWVAMHAHILLDPRL